MANVNTAGEMLKQLIDQHGLASVMRSIEQICFEKAAHVEENWQERNLAREWTKIGTRLGSVVLRAEAFEARAGIGTRPI